MKFLAQLASSWLVVSIATLGYLFVLLILPNLNPLELLLLFEGISLAVMGLILLYISVRYDK